MGVEYEACSVNYRPDYIADLSNTTLNVASTECFIHQPSESWRCIKDFAVYMVPPRDFHPKSENLTLATVNNWKIIVSYPKCKHANGETVPPTLVESVRPTLVFRVQQRLSAFTLFIELFKRTLSELDGVPTVFPVCDIYFLVPLVRAGLFGSTSLLKGSS